MPASTTVLEHLSRLSACKGTAILEVISKFMRESFKLLRKPLHRSSDTEGQHGEVVVLLGTVAEALGVGLQSLYDVAATAG